MDYEAALKLSHEAQALDPREAICGYYSTSSFVLSSAGAFLWFKTIEDMIVCITEAEPAIYEIPEREENIYSEQVSKLLKGLSVDKLNEDLREQTNEAAKKFLMIMWWGTLGDLTSGEFEYALEHRREFYEMTKDIEDVSPIADSDMGEFIKFTQEYGV